MSAPTYGYGVTEPGYGLDPYGDPLRLGLLSAQFGQLEPSIVADIPNELPLITTSLPDTEILSLSASIPDETPSLTTTISSESILVVESSVG